MATTFKTFLNNDMVTSRTLLHEAIPLTGGLVSGTYADTNIKNFSHGAFQSTYDYPYLSSSANHILDVTMGYVTGALSASTSVQNDKKVNMYYQMAQVLMGYDIDGQIRKFDADGDLSGGDKHDSVFFLNFSRLLTKDEIQKGTFSMTLLTGGAYPAQTIGAHWLEIRDTNAANNYFVNSPAGEYGILKTYDSGANGHTDQSDGTSVLSAGPGMGLTASCGLIFYQAGIVVLTSSVFHQLGGVYNPAHSSSVNVLTGSSISGACDNVRSRIHNIYFNNTTELNSTIYFCRANHNEFNYSGNLTYLSASELVVKNKGEDTPVAYITTIGLYSADNELLAVAKLSEPIRKDPTTELTFRVRLDY